MGREELKAYFLAKKDELSIVVRDKGQDLRRLEAQRNELNTKGTPFPSFVALADHASVRMLREELQLLHEAGSYVGEVVKAMGKNKVLVKVGAAMVTRLDCSQ